MQIKKALISEISFREANRSAILYVRKMLIMEKRKGKIIVAVSFVPKRVKAIAVKPICPRRNTKTGYPI